MSGTKFAYEQAINRRASMSAIISGMGLTTPQEEFMKATSFRATFYPEVTGKLDPIALLDRFDGMKAFQQNVEFLLEQLAQQNILSPEEIEEIKRTRYPWMCETQQPAPAVATLALDEVK